MGKLFKGIFTGLGIGAVIAVGLYLLGMVIEFFNCACNILSCRCNFDAAIPAMWSWSAFFNIMMLVAGGGAVIGGIAGMCLALQEAKRRAVEEAERRRLAEQKMRQEQAKKLYNDAQSALQHLAKCQNNINTKYIDFSIDNGDRQQYCWKTLLNACKANSELKKMIDKINN